MFLLRIQLSMMLFMFIMIMGEAKTFCEFECCSFFRGGMRASKKPKKFVYFLGLFAAGFEGKTFEFKLQISPAGERDRFHHVLKGVAHK